MKNFQSRKGITLIALVVTIIVLIILATITLNLLLGDNGIVIRAIQARDDWKTGEKEEQGRLKELENYVLGSENRKRSLYSWDLNVIEFPNLAIAMQYLKINSFYQEVDINTFSNNLRFKDLSNFLKNNNVDLYLIDGEHSSWNKAAEIKKYVDKIYEYNNVSENKIKGLVIDIEFHILPDVWDDNASLQEKENILGEYISTMKSVYEYAKMKNVEFVLCIPSWYDTISMQKLEELISQACDYTEIMNFSKANTIYNIENELKIAKKYNKPIISLAELQKENTGYGVTEDITFYNDGIVACNENLKKILDTYNYSNLGVGYHYYLPVIELLGKIVELKDLYNYQLYTYDSQSVPIEISEAYLKSGDISIRGIPEFVSGEYMINFYGLEHDKEYTLVIEDNPLYVYNKVINYTSNGQKWKYDSVIISLNQGYNYQLYFYDQSDVPLEIKNAYLESENIKIIGTPEFMSDSGEYAVTFYNLEYGREYKLVIEDNQAYEYNKTIKYNNDGEDWKYDGITVIIP